MFLHNHHLGMQLLLRNQACNIFLGNISLPQLCCKFRKFGLRSGRFRILALHRRQESNKFPGDILALIKHNYLVDKILRID
jgi:hypothetical protein